MLLAAAYLILALWPASSENEKERSAAVAHVNEMLAVGLSNSGAPLTSSRPATTAKAHSTDTPRVTANGPQADKIDFVTSIRQLNDRILTPDVRFRIRSGAMHWTAMAIKPEEVETAGTIMLTTIRPEIRERILKTAISLDRSLAFDAASTTQTLAASDLQHALDKVETFLLRREDWQIPDFITLPPN